ncbi:Sel-1 suppressor of lin-12-like [Perkinsus chesapeaki]|uniref:Sel-1 suppressor of lin-12-like n=1 Tax=Perkinsus chesapeaki TaxID=330153 RepID=A0A7J6MNU0_PERCH|nr:Sel-1 suppressor of lin-12-like [Perkinsus chesapeaki]
MSALGRGPSSSTTPESVKPEELIQKSALANNMRLLSSCGLFFDHMDPPIVQVPIDGDDGIRQRRIREREVDNNDNNTPVEAAGEAVDEEGRRPRRRDPNHQGGDGGVHHHRDQHGGIFGGGIGKCGAVLAILIAFFALDVLQFIIFGDNEDTPSTGEGGISYWSSGTSSSNRQDDLIVYDKNKQWGYTEYTDEEESGRGGRLHATSTIQQFQRAMDYLNSGHLQEGYDKFLSIYQSSGNLTALAYAGQCELPLNSTRAAQLLEIAANGGEPHAQFILGLYYSNNRGDPNRIITPGDHEMDYGKGILYLYASSTGGDTGALMTMGYRHYYGYGVPRNCETAAMNYIEIAQRIAHIYSTGLPQAVELVRLNLQGVLAGETGNKKGLSPNEISLFKQLAYGGDVNIASAVGKRFLLGVEGFQQSYSEARKFLQIGAAQSHPQSEALLGYMYCLGLGMDVDMVKARQFFSAAADKGDSLGLNGLGYLDFEARDFDEAFLNFNNSALKGSADGMFNLASLYLTGTGTVQSFPTAFMWYAQALERGHTPAAYALAIMHLNGVGTVRDCRMAVKLLKEVAERGDWVTNILDAAYAQKTVDPRASALSFLQLAEAGNEVSQSNLAHLLDRDHVKLFSNEAAERYDIEDEANRGGGGVLSPKTDSMSLVRLLSPLEVPNASGRVLAQRFYEMSADQGSPSSELRLGDFAYYGWGIGVELADTFNDSNILKDYDDNNNDEIEVTRKLQTAEIRYYRQDIPDYENALSHYRRTADTHVISEWMQPFIGQARFDVGFMYQWGLGGVPMDLSLAAKHYEKCIEAMRAEEQELQRRIVIDEAPPQPQPSATATNADNAAAVGGGGGYD